MENPIRTREEYEVALNELEAMVAKPLHVGSVEAERLKSLSIRVEEYETKQFPIDLPTPVEAIRFRMEQQGLQPDDLIPYIGSAERVRAVLGGEQRITLTMARALHRGLGIPRLALLGGTHD